MKYYCKECGEEYTLPHGDHLIEKKKMCECGKPADEFALKKAIVIESPNWIGCDSLFKMV